MYRKELADALNRALGAEVWFSTHEEPVPVCLVIGEDGGRAGFGIAGSDELNAMRTRPHRVVLTVVLREGQALISCAAVDFSEEYPRGTYQEIGAEAVEEYRRMCGFPEDVRAASYAIHDDWDTEGVPHWSPGFAAEGFLPLDDALADALMREGWPEKMVRDVQENGGAYHPGRRSLRTPDFPLAELRWNGEAVIVDMRSER